MRYSSSLYAFYIFCITAIICTTKGMEGTFLIKYNLPLVFLFIYFLVIWYKDSKGLFKAVAETKYVCLFVCVMLFGIFRSNVPKITFSQILINLSSVLIYYLSTCHAIRCLLERNDTKRILNLIMIPFLIFGSLNILFFFLGFSRDVIVATGAARMMGLFGMSNFQRVNFFFVGGVNSYGSVDGALLAIAIGSFMFKIYDKRFILAAIAVFLAVLFFTDCRGALLSAIISIVVALIIRRRKVFSLLKIIPYFGILAPIIFVGLLPLLATSSAFSFLSRGSNDLATGNARTPMWQYIYRDVVDNGGITIFGYGENGLAKTSAYNPISQMFPTMKGMAINPQNSLIAIVLDNGCVGLISFVLILFSGVKKIKRSWELNPNLLTILTSTIIYLLLIGITETFIGLYYDSAYIVFIYIFCLMCSIPKIQVQKFNIVTSAPTGKS